MVITGMGAASALGTGIEAHRAALFHGVSGIRRATRFDTRDLPTHLGAFWPEWDGRAQPEPGRERDLFATAEPFPLHELARTAAHEAWSTSGAGATPRRTALVFGTCFGQGFREFDAVARRVARALRIEGPCLTISTACSSSTNAIGLARDLLLDGTVDAVIAGGADTLLREAFAGFSALGVLSEVPCAPFSEPVGTTLGEGAGFLVLERAEDLRARPSWGSIAGYGLSSDGHHETTPDPSGDGVARSIRSALADAGWRREDVDFVSAHATGTENNDRVEWSAIVRELGVVATSGAKAHLGHTQGASGVLELILALLSHEAGCVPPTLHFRTPRAGCPVDPIAQATPRVMTVRRAIKLSAAFGGANAALAYECGTSSAPTQRPRSSVVIDGAGVVGTTRMLTLADASSLLGQRSSGPCGDVDLHALGVDPQRLDRSSRWLTGAAALALRGVRRSDATGLFVGATRMPEQSARKCAESIRTRGVRGTSAAAFARMSVNAPTGACSQALGLLGPTSTLSIGAGSGLLAITLAADWLSLRGDASTIVAGGVSEPRPLADDDAEGAACLAMRRSHQPSHGTILLAAWCIAGRHAADEACAHVMRDRAPVDCAFVDSEVGVASLGRWIDPASAIGTIEARAFWGESDAARSAVMTAVAASLVSAGRARSVLLVAEGGSATVAAVLAKVMS